MLNENSKDSGRPSSHQYIDYMNPKYIMDKKSKPAIIIYQCTLITKNITKIYFTNGIVKYFIISCMYHYMEYISENVQIECTCQY